MLVLIVLDLNSYSFTYYLYLSFY